MAATATPKHPQERFGPVGDPPPAQTHGSGPPIPTIWKVEGFTDALALRSLEGFPAESEIFVNAFGASENPEGYEPELEKMNGHHVAVIHDSDQAGIEGALGIPRKDGTKRPGWAQAIARYAISVRYVRLPYELEKSHGKDLRDYLSAGATYEDLLNLYFESEIIDAPADVEIEPIEADDDPHRLARVNLDRYRASGRNLVYWRGAWFRYDGRRYTEITVEYLRGRIADSIKAEFDRINRESLQEGNRKEDGTPPKAHKVTGRLVADVMLATQGMCQLSWGQRLNAWIGDDQPEGQCVAVDNGILNMTRLIAQDASMSEILRPASPDWFSTICLPYRFDLKADCPRWEEFLDQIFAGDESSIEILQMWFGYLLTSSIAQHKMLMIIGPPRSGKGTMQLIIRRLLGEENVASPTLTSLVDTYGLSGLVGKTAAIIPDARLSSRADHVAITETLLSITGGDPQDIRRKYRDTLTGHQLGVRFTLFSNQLPALRDTSAAFMSRCLFLETKKSFVGKEDPHLLGKLLEELPGILNWALVGVEQLQGVGMLRQPENMCADSIREFQFALSPVSVFVGEECQRSGHVEASELFDAWCKWCRDQGANHGYAPVFSRQLKACCPDVTTHRIWNEEKKKRVRVYQGISLRQQPGVIFE